jgi:hypothetical protein
MQQRGFSSEMSDNQRTRRRSPCQTPHPAQLSAWKHRAKMTMLKTPKNRMVSNFSLFYYTMMNLQSSHSSSGGLPSMLPERIHCIILSGKR